MNLNANYNTFKYRKGYALEVLVWPTAWQLLHVLGACVVWASTTSN